jgi:cellulose synthase (UDP-forming)
MFESAADDASILLTNGLVCLGLLLMARLLKPQGTADRALFGLATALLIVTYAAWRWHDTMPRFELTATSLWPWLFFAFEGIAMTYTLISIIILVKRRDNSAEADRAEALNHARGSWPAVDVFICTYNEPVDVLEKAVLCALAMDYPNFTVWVLDDTRRDWLRQYAEEVGAFYITRPDNVGAKAGNLNNGLRRTAEATNAPLILVLDADFAPRPNMLRRMVGLFHDRRVGVVQTPQFYYNADPIQHNLMIRDSWVDDQRIFFDIFQPSKDAWDCAFCVGTSFIVRRDLLNEMGGFPQEAMSEDIHLTYSLLHRGYVTRWLNERLSIGLSAEGLPEYITQRTRWCLGTIQVALLKSGPMLGAGYTLTQRLHYFHGILNWLCKPFIVLMLLAPSMYWFAGLPAFEADYIAFLRYGLPMLFAVWIYSGWVSERRTLPVFMEVTHTLTALAVTVTLASAIVRPFGRPFKVTDKGGDRSEMRVHWRMAGTFGAVALLSAGSIVWAFVSPYAAAEVSSRDLFNLIWAGVAMILAFIAMLVCFELPRPSPDEYFPVDTITDLREGDLVRQCLVKDLSLSAARLMVQDHHRQVTEAELYVPDVGWVRASLKEAHGQSLELDLSPTTQQRRALVVKLFTTSGETVARSAHLGKAVRGLLRRAAGLKGKASEPRSV